MNDRDLGSSNSIPELNEKDENFINDLDKMKTDSQKEAEKYLKDISYAGAGPAPKHIDELQEKEANNIHELKEPVRSGIVRPEEEGKATENTEEEKERKKPAEFDWTEYTAKAQGRFQESEKFEEKAKRINIQKNIGFERMNEGFMKVIYVGPDKEGNARIMYLYGYGSLQSSILYLQAVYSTGHMPVGNHTLDLKNGFSIEWYSYERYMKEARQIELELEKWEGTQTAEAKEKRKKEVIEEGLKALEIKGNEQKAKQYDELKNNRIVKLFRLIK